MMNKSSNRRLLGEEVAHSLNEVFKLYVPDSIKARKRRIHGSIFLGMVLGIIMVAPPGELNQSID